MYSAEIVAHSVSEEGAEIVTYAVTYPGIVHAQCLRHRGFTRSVASTRAIPMPKQLKRARENPFVPIHWGKNQKGMQAEAELSGQQAIEAENVWRHASSQAAWAAELLTDIGVHKQIAGRLLQPFSYTTEVITTTMTALNNFFAVRCHYKTQPEEQKLAVMMARKYMGSEPILRKRGERYDDIHGWHLPYVTDEDRMSLSVMEAIGVCSARVARTSYLRHDGTPAPIDEDLDLFRRLSSDSHWSPLESPAYPAKDPRKRSGNFEGWIQYRQELPVSVHRRFEWSLFRRMYADRDFVTSEEMWKERGGS